MIFTIEIKLCTSHKGFDWLLTRLLNRLIINDKSGLKLYFQLHWWTYRCRRRLPKITLKATRQNVYFKNTRRRWREINLEEEVLIFKRLRKYVYVKKEA